MVGKRAFLLLLSLIFCLPVWGQITTISQAPFTGGVLTQTITVPAGSGTATYKPCGVLHINTTATGTPASVGAADLMSYTVPANTLSANGQLLQVLTWGTFAANGNTKTVTLDFGGTAVDLIGAGAFNNATWLMESTITRTGAAAQTTIARRSVSGSTSVQGVYAIISPTVTLSSNAILKVYGTNGSASANDVTASGMIVSYCP